MSQILLVEDDPSLRNLISHALAEEGYSVITASNGACALDLLEDSAADLILLNIYMPVMDGRGFVQAYRQKPGPHAPIVIVTGASHPAQRAAALDAAGYLAKPFELNELYAKLEELIGHPPIGTRQD